MKPKKWAAFWAGAFPDDTVETEHDIVVFPGRNIAEALIPILAEAGCTDIGEPSHEHEHGWHVVFRSDGKWFYLQVSRIEPETLLLFQKNYVFEGLFHRGPSRPAVLIQKLQPLIGADPRFRGVTWHTQEELDAGGWLTPLEAIRDEATGDA